MTEFGFTMNASGDEEAVRSKRTCIWDKQDLHLIVSIYGCLEPFSWIQGKVWSQSVNSRVSGHQEQ